MRTLETKLLQLLIALIPVQLSYHFWPSFSLIFGVRVDYLSPTIFITDLVIFAIFSIHLWNRRAEKFYLNWFVLALFILAVVNISTALSQPVALYKWGRAVEYLILGFILLRQKGTWFVKPLFVASIYTVIIASGQFLLQKNIGGILYWIGERPLSSDSVGMATITLFGQEMLRPYATFPHPNVLGAFGLVGLIVLFPFWKNSRLVQLGILSAAVSILISFSHAVWVATILFFFLKRYSKQTIQKIVYLSFIVVVVLSAVSLFIKPDFENYSIDSRFALANTAGRQIAESPIVGMGLGNFVPANQLYVLDLLVAKDARLRFQPVHNVPLLLLSEVGLLGVGVLVVALLRSMRNANKYMQIAVVIILATSLVDHYWLTLHQGTLLLVLLLVQLTNYEIDS